MIVFAHSGIFLAPAERAFRYLCIFTAPLENGRPEQPYAKITATRDCNLTCCKMASAVSTEIATIAKRENRLVGPLPATLGSVYFTSKISKFDPVSTLAKREGRFEHFIENRIGTLLHFGLHEKIQKVPSNIASLARWLIGARLDIAGVVARVATFEPPIISRKISVFA